ncbi:hypothetical protein EKO27_g5759 [Xylaria grammica]|uniref:Uncharacterized protein n=1 Tax=Xylaria grammica TaxID=363999 RepID=A0A439D4K4_9PEZI|nr:hypothetical protein EKO27_g5759 [Xylaria grammica]
MSHRSHKIFGGAALRMGVRLVAITAIVAARFATAAPAPALVYDGVVKTASCLVSDNTPAEDSCNDIYGLIKKQGPYTYGNDAPYHNSTSTSSTLIITLTSTNATTKTDVEPSLSGSIPMLSATTVTTSYGTLHAQTTTDSCNFIQLSPIVDGPTNAATRASSSTSNWNNTSTPDDQSPSTQLPIFTTTFPHTVVTTTIWYSASNSEEFTGTETVTKTPYITITKRTTTTLSSASETPAIGITTIKANPSPAMPTHTQTEATGNTISAADITTSEVITITVMQTVSPIPTRSTTTECTEPTMTGYDSVALVSHSLATVRSTLIITVASGDLVPSMDVSAAGATAETSTTMSVAASGTETTSTNVGTTHETPSAVINSTFLLITITIPLATTPHTPYPVSNTASGSAAFGNSTSGVTVGITVTAPANVTVEGTTKHTGSAHMPDAHLTDSAGTAYPTNTTGPIGSGAGSGKKRPVQIFWGDSDGGCSSTCVILLVMIFSLVL